MKKPPHKYRWVFGGLLVIVLLFVGVVLFIPTQSKPPLSFQYYEPTYLPPGVSITGKALITSNKSNEVWYASLYFRKVDGVYEIQELPAAHYAEAGQLTTNLTNYDQTSVKPTCKQGMTAKSQSYRLCHWIDYGTYSVYEINFVKTTTLFKIRMNYDPDKVLSDTSLNSFIDSFKPAGTHTIPRYKVGNG